MHAYRTHHCNALDTGHVGEIVRLSGWVHRKRDHGSLLFIDLRDHYGITQCVTDAEDAPFAGVESVRVESVVTVTGRVVVRSKDTINPNLPTGHVEVRIDDFTVQSAADQLPLQVNSDQDAGEEFRLRHRTLDLRRQRVHQNIVLRSRVIASLRRRMNEQGFLEYQTPILTASSPEGARDFLVPARLHPGRFYALPQAPQQFKQLIMVAGFDRYFQIAPCFRDEDSRADRSPGEFYQLDLEMSFVTQEDVFDAVEPVLHGVFEEFIPLDWPREGAVNARPFPHIPYRDAMLKYGTDKPDLRNPLEICDVTDIFADSGFAIFRRNIEKGAVVRAVPGPKCGSRAICDRMNSWAQGEGAPGMGYIIFDASGGKGPIAKQLTAEQIATLKQRSAVGAGDALFFACDKAPAAAALAGRARTKLGADLELVDHRTYRFCWIVDFPMYEVNEVTNALEFSHNPFSMPQGGLEALENRDPLDILAYQYDLVCNGVELSSGAIRNHRPDIMYKAFEIAGYSRETVDQEFGGMINAFRYGAPPHGGIAPGIDRIVMLLADVPNIREVIMFPMNQKAEDLMMNAPGAVSEEQLRELHIRLALPPKERASD